MPSSDMSQSALLLPSAELNLGGTTTTENQFLIKTATAGVPVTAALPCRIPGSSILKNRPFFIRVGGRVTGGTSGNFTAALYYGNSATVGSNTKLATTGAINVNTAGGTWNLDVRCSWDSTSQTIRGQFSGYVYATVVAAAILSNSPTSVDLSTEPNLATASGTQNVLTVTGTFGSGNASNVAYVDWFEVMAL